MLADYIIDNRDHHLLAEMQEILKTPMDAVRLATGYFYLSGFTSLAGQLAKVCARAAQGDGARKGVRLLIGNTTNHETLEQMAEGKRRLDLVQKKLEEERFPNRNETREIVAGTAGAVRGEAAALEQTDANVAAVRLLVDLIAAGHFHVKVYTKGWLHAKAYIFDYGQVYDESGNPVPIPEKGRAIVGSSNLTLSGVTHNTELNVVLETDAQHVALVQWFDRLWEEASDFDAALMQELKESWALAQVRPYDIYLKTLYTLVQDRLAEGQEEEPLWDDDIFSVLADFQRVAVKTVAQMIRDYGGAFVADVVGLGKSYIGAAIVKHFERTAHARPLIICPAALVDMWERYSEVYDLNARVMSMGLLADDSQRGKDLLDLKKGLYRDRDFVLVDESHNFRNTGSQRYGLLATFLSTGKHCCFLTATPRSKSAWDLYHQIKLWHPNEQTELPVDPPNLRAYFKLVEKGERRLQDLLANVLYRRTRNDVLRWYGYDAETDERLDPARFQDYRTGRRKAYVLVGTRKQFFPRRDLETVSYSIEDTYQGLYQQIRGMLGRARKKAADTTLCKGELCYARYGLWHYVLPDRQKKAPYADLQRAGYNLRGIMRVMLFKRFESSVHAFRETIKRVLHMHEKFLTALDAGIVPAGEDAQQVLYESDRMDDTQLLDALREAGDGRYSAADFDVKKLRKGVEHDRDVLKSLLELVAPITAAQDAKLLKLRDMLAKAPLVGKKVLIFTQYADTADYLFRHLNPDKQHPDIEVIYSGDKSKARIVGLFAPKANPEFRRQASDHDIRLLIATDVLSEGLNLQDCDCIINYDLHWNPVRLIQRFGRIDRIGSEHEEIHALNFLPETALDKQIDLKGRLHNRIQEIHDTIGEDAAILDSTEELNEQAMYAIYEQKSDQLSLFEESDEEEALVDLTEAEEMMRRLQREDPAEYARIADLRDGIRTARAATSKGSYVFCKEGRYQQLYLLDPQGHVVTREAPKVLGFLKCDPHTQGAEVPPEHNATLTRTLRAFAEEARKRRVELEHTMSLTHGQRYVLRELRLFRGQTSDEDEQGRIDVLERAMRGALTPAVLKELNRLRKGEVTGKDLVRCLGELYHQHSLRDVMERRENVVEEQPAPAIVCSEHLY